MMSCEEACFCAIIPFTSAHTRGPCFRVCQKYHLFSSIIGNTKEDMRSEDEDEEPKEGSSHIGQKKRKKSTIAKTKPASNVALSLAVETFTPTLSISCTTRNLGIYDYLYN
jgi:hypothetical protein